jgi:SAM-dependent methyltransferase
MQRGFNVTAINFSGEMVRICREKSINASVMDFYDIANLGRTYHCIWAMNCLLHVPKPDLHKVLCGINAVLSDGGLFFMGVYGGADIEREKTDLAICDMPRFFSFYSESSLKGLLADIFDILAFRQYSIGGTYDFQSVTMRKKRSSGSFE